MGRISRIVVILACAWFVSSPAAQAAQTAAEPEWTATINGRNLLDVDPNAPLVLDPAEPATIEVAASNTGSADLDIARIRLEGRVLGLAFFVYTTDVNIQLPPGDDDARAFQLNMRDLDGQATGSLPARLVLLDAQDNEIDSLAFPVTVDGSLRSVYGTFGLAVAAMTLILLISALWRLASSRLPHNRWRRALIFATPGLGVGFVLTFTLSALELVVPTPSAWGLMILVGGAIGFTVGYFTPTPSDDLPLSRAEEWRGFTDEHADPSDNPSAADGLSTAPSGARHAEGSGQSEPG